MSRTHHTVCTKYNVSFNGNESYKEGLEKIAQANQDDYSHVLPMFPISRHENASAATANMDKTIEKSRKSIKLHSIKKKPQRNTKKANDPKYKAWYSQQEFNSALDEAWLLLAKAEFHKGEFLSSIGTFLYITKHYANDTDVVAQCQLWIARAYAEMDWIYEAEEVLLKIKQDELKRANAILYANVHADILLKKKQYREAIPFLQLSINGEKKKTNQTRFRFILGQLHQLTGNKPAAEEAYTKVIKANPAFEMEFNARINQAQISNNTVATLKKLSKMVKQYKFKDNLDQVYGTIGNIHLQKGDTTLAIQNYKLAIEKSTQSGIGKAVVLVTLGDLYYERRNYVDAQPCYDEASKIISAEDEDYPRISKRAETLSELIVEHNTIILQDSLIHLSTLSEKEQMEIVLQVIANLEASEKAAEEAALRQNEELTSVNTSNMIGGNAGGNNDWYFYNTNLIKAGRVEFAKKWGQRKLEDNWRRLSKAATNNLADNYSEIIEENSNDSIVSNNESTIVPITDTKNPDFYLQQIPKNDAQRALANETVATAMYNMGFIYKDRVQDANLALQTFDNFENRYATDKRLLNVYYTRYLIHLQQHNSIEAEYWRLELISKFPNSKQALILTDPNYAERMNKMNMEQDSLYQATYNAYSAGNFTTVFAHKEYAEKNYPLSPLMPKFLLINALSIAKTENPIAFGDALRDMITRYPDSDVSAMAKDMLAMMNQGMESQIGDSHGTLLARREETLNVTDDNNITANDFATELNTASTVVIFIPASQENLNQLLYQVALFNFSQFLIKDFDLNTTINFNTELSMLKISNMDSLEEAKWYINIVNKNADLTTLFTTLNAQLLAITETNLALLISKQKSLEDYLLFRTTQK